LKGRKEFAKTLPSFKNWGKLRRRRELELTLPWFEEVAKKELRIWFQE